MERAVGLNLTLESVPRSPSIAEEAASEAEESDADSIDSAMLPCKAALLRRALCLPHVFV